MTAQNARIGLRSLALLAVGSFLLLFAARDAEAAISFNPISSTCLDDTTTAQTCDGDPTAGAVTDVRGTFDISAPDANFGGNVGFIPDAIVAQIDSGTPVGAVVAQLSSVASLGLLNNACNSSIPVEFTMLNGSIDTSDTVSPKPPGQANALEPLALDSDNDGLANGVEKYPSYLNTEFNNAQPIIRSIGITLVPGVSDWIVLNFVVFPKGTQLPDRPLFDDSLGFPSAVILQDPTAPPSQSAISDFCSPLQTTTFTFGHSRDNVCTPDPSVSPFCPQRPPVDPSQPATLDPDGCDSDTDESGCVIRKNPADGSYTFTTWVVSQRDLDGDGHENGLDSCFNDAEPNWDPRASDATFDADGDGLTTACDPNPSVPSQASDQSCPAGQTGPDEDRDCFSNRQDNCPLVPNDQTDDDGDGIGDAPGCDPDPSTPSGERAEMCLATVLTIPSSPVAEVLAPYSPPCVVAGAAQGPGGTGGTDGTGGGTDGTGGGDGTTGGTGGTGGAAGGGAGGPDTGVGSLAPAVSSIPTWAAIASGLGGAGLLGSLGTFLSRFLHRRRRQ